MYLGYSQFTTISLSFGSWFDAATRGLFRESADHCMKLERRGAP
jgi:hypothetical protein